MCEFLCPDTPDVVHEVIANMHESFLNIKSHSKSGFLDKLTNVGMHPDNAVPNIDLSVIEASYHKTELEFILHQASIKAGIDDLLASIIVYG